LSCEKGSLALVRLASRRSWTLAAWIAINWLASPTAVCAQDDPAAPPERPSAWTGTVGGGLALTSGNTDSLTYNLTLDLWLRSSEKSELRWTARYLRGTQNDFVVVDRLSLGFRDEYTFSPRVFVFGKIDYLHDTFKLIDYFVAPAVGLGFNVVETPATRFSVDFGGGTVTERNPGDQPTTTAGIQAGETLQHDLNATASIKHSTTAVWNVNNFASTLVTASIGLATRITTRFHLSIDLIDSFKTLPPTAATARNDINVIVAITAKY
jgi:putative salt-induced outer membrane protein YdiY